MTFIKCLPLFYVINYIKLEKRQPPYPRGVYILKIRVNENFFSFFSLFSDMVCWIMPLSPFIDISFIDISNGICKSIFFFYSFLILYHFLYLLAPSPSTQTALHHSMLYCLSGNTHYLW